MKKQRPFCSRNFCVDPKFHMVLAMKTSGFGAGWTLLGRLWCACWRGAKGTSCSHLSWCTAWGRFLSHKFFKISGFGWICTSFPNLSLKIRTDSCCFFAVNHPGSSEAPLALPAALGGWFYGDKHHKTPSKLPRVSLRTRLNSLNIPPKVLKSLPILSRIRRIPVDKLNPEHLLILGPKRKSWKKNYV